MLTRIVLSALAALAVVMGAGCGGTTVVTKTVTQAARVAHPAKLPVAAPAKLSVAERCRKLIPTENPNAPGTTQAACEYSLTPHPPPVVTGKTAAQVAEVKAREDLEAERKRTQRQTCRDIESAKEETGAEHEPNRDTTCGHERVEREEHDGELSCNSSGTCEEGPLKKEREQKRDRQLEHINERQTRGENIDQEYREYEAGKGWQRF
jgi:hypothetical protein